MDTARHVIETFFKTTLNPMTRHHLDSFNDFLDIKLPRFIQASNPLKLLLEDDRSIYTVSYTHLTLPTKRIV